MNGLALEIGYIQTGGKTGHRFKQALGEIKEFL
jgi:hypothetical protein